MTALVFFAVCVFLSTPSARRATRIQRHSPAAHSISIHALREEGDEFVIQLKRDIRISIHALREEGDPLAVYSAAKYDISIHALREEGDHRPDAARQHRARFLSTPSARRATHTPAVHPGLQVISIHALREEGDSCPDVAVDEVVISIHALREEGDNFASSGMEPVTYFYPRPPRGGRPSPLAPRSTLTRFLSTPSARRATNLSEYVDESWQFLSTPSARRATDGAGFDASGQPFLSTPSARRATGPAGAPPRTSPISIHALREEGDLGIG